MNNKSKVDSIMILLGILIAVIFVLGIEFYEFDNNSLLFGFIVGIYITIGILIQHKDKEHFINRNKDD